MIYIRLAGGLGNQLFQLGIGMLFAQKNGIDGIVIDTSALTNYNTERKCEIEKILDFSKSHKKIIFKKYFFTKFRIPKIAPINIFGIAFVSDKNFITLLEHNNFKSILIDGYFQFELKQEIFDAMVDLLKQLLIQGLDNFNKDCCVIHIRGGDFIEYNYDAGTKEKYFLNAMQFMADRHDINRFLVVTDDQDYAELMLRDANFSFNIVKGDIKSDFFTMASCVFNIISASTFSLWACALGESDCIIAPGYWGHGVKREFYLLNEVREREGIYEK